MNGIEAAFFGTLTRDADHRTSKAGKPFTMLNAVAGDGEGRQYVSVVVFGEAALGIATLEKGRRIYVEGKIAIDEWTGRDGARRAGFKVTSFHAIEVSKIGRRRERKAGDDTPAASGETPGTADLPHDDLPW